MGKKVESYLSEDGKLFRTEREMVLHEIDVAVRKEFPALKIGLGQIALNADRLLEILQPLANLQTKNHPEVKPENHPATDHGELAGLCDCSAGFSGADDHAVSCPRFKPAYTPRWNACPPLAWEPKPPAERAVKDGSRLDLRRMR